MPPTTPVPAVIFRRVHVAALALSAVFLPWSTALLSMAQMLLAANWIVGGLVRGDLRACVRAAFATKPVLVYLSFLGLHILGLMWTSPEGMEWGLDLVRILAPVLTFGAVLAGSPPLDKRELRFILLMGAWSVVASTLACLVMYDPVPGGYREFSRFISHIRLALLLCFAVVVFIYYCRGPRWLTVMYATAAVWAVSILDRLGSIQGFVILAAVGAVLLWRWVRGSAPPVRYGLRALLLAVPLAMLVFLGRALDRYYRLPVPEHSGWGQYTAGTEPYTFDATNPQMENGRHVWAWVALEEVERTWRLRSDRPLDGPDAQGRPLRGTLLRYLTSQGARKDSLAVMALSDAEVRAIEAGRHNVLQGRRSKLAERFDEVMFEIGQYRAYGRADGHSVAMRLEFLRAGLKIAGSHWATGVGTGDTKPAFADQYERMGSSLAPEWRHRAHNEYLTLAISFGVFGLVWCLFAWWWPAYTLGAWRDPLFIAWAVVFGISCLTDDTVETQAGATFFGLYYALLVFGRSVQRRAYSQLSIGG